jgi:hypothetical protein
VHCSLPAEAPSAPTLARVAKKRLIGLVTRTGSHLLKFQDKLPFSSECCSLATWRNGHTFPGKASLGLN